MCGVPDLHHQRPGLCCDAQVLVAQTPDQVEGLALRLRAREPERIGGDRRFHRRPDLGCRAKKTVRRHQPRQRLMRTLEVVVLDVQTEPSVAISKVGEDGPRQELLPQRLPEALDLAERLRVLRSALHMSDSVLSQKFLEGRLSAPRGVLTALVSQDLLGRAVRRHAALEGLEHEARLLVVRQRVRHQIPRVVVHEGGDVQPLVPSEEEGEDVALPELVRRGPLEATRRVRPRRRRRALVDESLLVQDPTHDRLRDPQSLEARQYVANATRAPLRVLRTGVDHRLSPRTRRLRWR